MHIETARDILKQRLSERRFRHCEAVSRRAAELARAWGGDVGKAELAGLLHDITKDETPEGQLAIFERCGVTLTAVERKTPKLWHAMTGAAVLARDYGVSDPELLAAVRYHTTARAGMSLLETIVYLADYISDDRTFEGVEELRARVAEGMLPGLRAALDFSVRELLQKGAPIHPDTINARNELLCGH